ncbi:unnamed protein product [Owenia fusiformis]|uniref:Epithelial cell-transforming sequence 2 oncogene-like n=1 Tax=Owenia fusiformis TaxID=6347 RepID=A0A8S4PYP6_OWEFU|nr:unnamed protein product [Owenia fusiformis]
MASPAQGGPFVEMDGSSKRTAKVSPIKRLILDDSKTLGKTIDKKKSATKLPEQYQSRNFKFMNSAWTPVVHRPSNEQIFKERKELVSHWYDMWTDSQRKKFLRLILNKSERSQLMFMQNWFQERVPLRHLDFAVVLPRFLTLYIFSFLDPRSLCRAAKVCWHWKFLAEQDILWSPKCMKQGWYIPYQPQDNEYGAWKKHYVACVRTLDMDVLSPRKNDMYGTIGDGTKIKPRFHVREKGAEYAKSWKLDPKTSQKYAQSRPKWQNPDKQPNDLRRSERALLHEFNRNDPLLPESALLFHDKFGTPKKHIRSTTDSGLDYTDYGLESKKRRGRHRTLTSGEDLDLKQETTKKTLLSERLEVQNLQETRLRELVDQPWMPPQKRVVAQRQNLAGGADYKLPYKAIETPYIPSMSYPTHVNPRVVFISSRVPAADLLMDAVLFGVIPIVYEYEGTTLESLLSRLEIVLQGRHTQSIGVFTHSVDPGEILLVHGCKVTIETLDQPEIIEFFETISNSILPPEQKGCVDIFAPIASCESGMETLIQLNILCGMQFSSPTGIIGNYNHINSEWSLAVDDTPPPMSYFCTSKLNIWANTADQVQEACQVAKKLLASYFQEIHKDVVSQVTGQVIFDAMGQSDIQGLNALSDILREGLMELGTKSNVKPVEFLGEYLLMKSGGTFDGTKQITEGDTLDLYSDEEDDISEGGKEVADITTQKLRPGDGSDIEEDIVIKEDDDIEEEIIEELEENLENKDTDEDENKNRMKVEKEQQNQKQKSKFQQSSVHPSKQNQRRLTKDTLRSSKTLMYSENPMSPDDKLKTQMRTMTDTKGTMRLTVKQFGDHPQKRTPIAHEILSSEVEYMRTLEIIRNVFVKPLKSALASNRAIISTHNVQVIFTDALTILELSRPLVADLKDRISQWNPHQCLGDIFVKFTGKLKAYVNFLNNYPTILLTIERCMEQIPGFRAFLQRHQRTPQTRMLTLQELLLTITRRPSEYVTLLTWFQRHTQLDHNDRPDVAEAIEVFRNLSSIIRDMKQKQERERELVKLQKTILNCPALMEANRFFVLHEDVAHLSKPTSEVAPELRVYQHIETLGLFLFNDSLIVTRRTSKHFPFERSVEQSYRFLTCVCLTRLRVEDIPDSKFVKNAFLMETPKRCWICSSYSYSAKLNWMTTLESVIQTAIENN